MNEWSFFAQSLDNSSPDVIVRRGRELSPQERGARADFQYELFEARERAKPLPIGGASVRASASPAGLLLEVETEQRDVEGRLAPIVAWADGSSTHAATEDLSAIRAFLSHIGRTISAETEREVCKIIASRATVPKKKSAKGTWYLIGLLLAVLCAAIWLIVSASSQN